MGIVLVDGQPVEVGDAERINGIQAARRAGVEIPHYCWHPGLSVVASCRMCLVESGARNPANGEVVMLPKLAPACQTPAKDGTVFVTNSEKVRQARSQVEEALLLRHPVDCPICDKAGECYLQDYHFQYGQKERRADIKPFTSRRRDVGDTVTLFVDRCVMCSRCVRFCREIAGTSELMIANRGSHEEIDVVPGFPLANKLAGNVVDLCPVGALGDKDFLYKQRVWFIRQHEGICTGCSTGCSIWIDENQDHVYRLKPRENPHVNQWWMCDEGRYGFHHVHDERRLAGTWRRKDSALEMADAAVLLPEIKSRLASTGRLAAVVSPHLTVEEAWLLAKFVRGIDPQAVLVPGPAPVVGTDEKFPAGFVIHAEKCPNRRGVEAILEHLGGEMVSFEEFLTSLESRDIRGGWVSGGYKNSWIEPDSAQSLAALDTLIVQDLFPSPLSQAADYLLGSAAFPERDGSYVNHAGRLQTARWAIRPPAGVWTEGQLFWHLLERPGLYQSRQVLDEIAAEVPSFAAAAEEIPPTGIELPLGELAEAR